MDVGSFSVQSLYTKIQLSTQEPPWHASPLWLVLCIVLLQPPSVWSQTLAEGH